MKKILKFAAGASVFALGCAAVELLTTKEQRKQFAYDMADKNVNILTKGLAAAVPKASWLDNDEDDDLFLSGRNGFEKKPAKGAKWFLGFDRKSIVPDDYRIKDYYIGGYLSYPPNVMTDVLDDQAVRAVCIDDSSGRGAAAFCVIDCVGISNTDVCKIRELLKDFAEENNIVSINVSATHCHSAIDTMGLWGDILNKSLKNNIKAIMNDDKEAMISGRDPEFMKNLAQSCALVIKNAFLSMTPGELYMSVTDELPYARDKREPDVFDKDIVKLRFKPDDGSRETVAVCMGAHAVALGEKNTSLSGDYPIYIEKQINKMGANCIFFQGAQLAIAASRAGIVPEDFKDCEPFMEYGYAIGRFLMSGKLDEKRLEPVFNIRHNSIKVKCDNNILVLAGKLGLVNNKMIIDGKKRDFSTEIGFAQFGSGLSVALVPGEIAPELILGGANDRWRSYRKVDFVYPPLKELVKGDSKLVTFGLCNDSIGYILPDNDFGSIFAPKHYEESVSAGKNTGSAIIRSFSKLLDEFFGA